MRAKRLVGCLLFIMCLFPALAHAQSGADQETIEGTVTGIREDASGRFLQFHVTKGSIAGEDIDIETSPSTTPFSRKYKVGDSLLVLKGQDFDGRDSYTVSDYIRRQPLYLLFGLFVLVSVVVAGRWGITSLLAMAYSFWVLFQFLLPRIIAGANPVISAVIAAVMIVPVTFYLGHGWNTKTHVAIVGTLIALIITGILSAIFVDITYLSGYGSEEAQYLQVGSQQFDIRGILLAGIIIGVLGILDDITVSQSSVVKELHHANPKLSKPRLFAQGMAVGRDHISSLVNTLILVYAGAAMPLFLLFLNSARPIGEIINYEPIAEELVRTLVGSIGLIIAVPITTLLASWYFSRVRDSGNSN